jgi:putative two-component system response regulator
VIDIERTRALNELVARLKSREAELARSRVETVERLGRAIELRDDTTGRHVERVGRYCSLLCRRLGGSTRSCDLIELASKLHDVGKIAISDAILDKQGPLTPEERKLMETHAQIGHDLLAGADEPLLDLAALIAYTHHERFDGSGYPRGLVGLEIPLEGRIAGLADVFDAITSDRPYRARLRLDQALAVLRSEQHGFDPEVLECFLGSLDDVVEIMEART